MSETRYDRIDASGMAILPEGATHVRDYAFRGCTGLTNLPAGIESVGACAFSGCTGLTSLPAGIKSVGYFAFDGCTGFPQITGFKHEVIVLGHGWLQVGCRCAKVAWWRGAEGVAFAEKNGWTAEDRARLEAEYTEMTQKKGE